MRQRASPFARTWSRALPLGVAFAAGLLAAAYRYGVAPDALAPVPAADAAQTASATPQPPLSYRGAVARAGTSVVSVYSSGQVSRNGYGPAVQMLSAGSGVVLDRSGFIVTNGRLFEGADQLVVALPDGTVVPAMLVGLDRGTGIALLKVDIKDLNPIEMGDMANVAVGDIVLAIGNPPGVGQTVSQGIVGAIGRDRNGIDGYIETDAAIPAGGYGGALVDTSGKLIGITAVTISIGDEPPNIRLAIPVDRVQEVVARLRKTGRDT
jgi:S1-C subfamily serine protease